MLGREEPRLARPQVTCRIPLQRPGFVLRYWHRWQLPIDSPREDPTGHARGKSQDIHHLVVLAKLTYLQIVWDTSKFNNKAEWPADGSQPFVLSTGDNTGYGQHGDYVFGWKDDSLQKAMDDAKGCMGANCGSLKTQQPADGNKCLVPNRVKEERDGWLAALPGMEGMPML